MTLVTRLDFALAYAGAGYKVIPLQPNGKLPLTTHGAHDGTTDEPTIRAWWACWPNANIGITLENLVVVDIDPRNGGDVDLLPHKLPDTCIARTGGGGLHYLYRSKNGKKYPGKLAPGIDVKSGPGSYICGENSGHACGGDYCWLDESEPWTTAPADAPEWLAHAPSQPAATNGEAPAAIPEGGRNSHLTSLAGTMRRRNMSVDAILSALLVENSMRCSPPLGDDEVKKIAASVGRYKPVPETPEATRFTRNQHGQIKASLGNVLLALQHPDIGGWRLARDTFRDEAMKMPYGSANGDAWEPFTDDDYTVVRRRLEEMRDPFMPIGLEMMRHCVSLAARENAFDSAVQWLNAITWDKVPRVELSLVKCFGAIDTPYVRAVGRYLWTALAGRVLLPGVQADMAPIAVGYQGLKKSRTIAAIAPYPDYFAEVDLSVDNADLARLMRGKVIAELAELQGLRNRELEHIKALISRSIDQWVPKYKEMPASYARRGIFVGSTNDDEFLSDQTGNRRWLPFTCGTCDPMAMAADREQLWAEGAVLFRDTGVAWQDAERLARHEHDQFMVTDPWDSSLARWLGLAGRDVDTPFTVADALESGIGLDMRHAKAADQMRVVKVLKRFGYRTSNNPQRIDGKLARCWRKKT